MRLSIALIASMLIGCSEGPKFEDSNLPFDLSIWQSSVNKRYEMLQSIYDHNVIGAEYSNIISLLGEPDGYYLYDEFPAYQLSETEDCVIAFIIDRKTEKVSDMSIEPTGCQAN
ncbi:TPA: hypothetical protein RQJ98_004434 [Vibrio vulnificus]|uniref:hypothetical protein n=1 Tax=Vibrio vulnificus TaxID=672 RepID=UPI0005F25555|nr:hypothetical protein [Vibrio vulnificus]MCG6311718.1 hypothetical protein [Vibrio vulnificus]HAS6364146.1 hypothetical protein [Vibrio vulnificus]HDY7544762.1 hypothetical protein [Vibrio vulnificus]HDY7685788.1 hypothetical protein [Vibrio vulnificus]